MPKGAVKQTCDRASRIVTPGMSGEIDPGWRRYRGRVTLVCHTRTSAKLLFEQCAENSHRPTQCGERWMQQFKSPEHGQRILSAHAFIRGQFRPRHHWIPANSYRTLMSEAFKLWRQEACAQQIAYTRSRNYPVVRWGNDTKVVRDVVAECVPVRGHSIAEKCQHRDAEFLEGGIAFVVCGVPVHQAP